MEFKKEDEKHVIVTNYPIEIIPRDSTFWPEEGEVTEDVFTLLKDLQKWFGHRISLSEDVDSAISRTELLGWSEKIKKILQ